MAFKGTGTFVRLYNWVTDKINSVPITASRMDTEMDGMAAGLSNCITKDGQTTITANIPMNSHKLTGLSVGNARTDSLTLGQVQDGQFTALGLTGGAADAYTASPSPAITGYVATMEYSAKIHATNLTTTPTLLISAISGGTIKKLDASKAEIAVEASDMLANGWYKFKRNVANDAWILLNPEIAKLPKQITIANNVSDANNDIDFSAGNFQFDDGTGIASLSALTKRLDATWAAGTNQGGLDTGTVANNTAYYLFAIYNPTSGISDALFSTSSTNPTMPSGYTKKKKIASLMTNGSAQIRNGIWKFNNDGSYEFIYLVQILDVSEARPGATAVLKTMTAPPNTRVKCSIELSDSSAGGAAPTVLITSPNQTDSTPSASLFTVRLIYVSATGENNSQCSYIEINLNSSSQLRYRYTNGDSSCTLIIFNKGWFDNNL